MRDVAADKENAPVADFGNVWHSRKLDKEQGAAEAWRKHGI